MLSSINKRLGQELETELHALLRAWFPRSIDREHGGFLCDFDRRWKPSGPQCKMLEYQARQTMAAARSAVRFAELREIAVHGFRYLKDRMWDRNLGGWYRMLDRRGSPLEGATKHGHGTSYAISACVDCHKLTEDPECLDLAQSAFTWLETHAHDELHGGYFVFYRQDGTPILSSNDPSQIRDAIGTPIGFKDANTTSDLLKCFYDLYRVWPDALLRRRVEELLCIVRDRLVVAPGVMHLYASADWTPVPDLVRYGQILRSANHLLAASEAISGGTIDSTTARVVKSMADTMLRIAWDPDQGGFHLAGSSFGPTSVENRIIFVRDKFWWPQTEGLKLLLWMAQLHPTDVADYFAQFARLWEYIKRYLIDPRHGGWFAAGLDTNPEARKRPKATIWKDCSHEVESLIDCLLIIKSL